MKPVRVGHAHMPGKLPGLLDAIVYRPANNFQVSLLVFPETDPRSDTLKVPTLRISCAVLVNHESTLPENSARDVVITHHAPPS